jgi:hypothetical protein
MYTGTNRTAEGEQPLIARRRGTLYRTQYLIHKNFTTLTRDIKKENRTYTTYMRKTAMQYVKKVKKGRAIPVTGREGP